MINSVWVYENGTVYLSMKDIQDTSPAASSFIEACRRLIHRRDITRKAIEKILFKTTPLTPYEQKKLIEYREAEQRRLSFQRFEEMLLKPPHSLNFTYLDYERWMNTHGIRIIPL